MIANREGGGVHSKGTFISKIRNLRRCLFEGGGGHLFEAGCLFEEIQCVNDTCSKQRIV